MRAVGWRAWISSTAPQSSCCSTGIDDVEKRMVHYVKAASTGCTKRTGAGPDHLLIGTVALFRMGKRVPAAEHHFRQPVHRGAARGPGPPSGAVQAAGAAPEGRARGCPAVGATLLG